MMDAITLLLTRRSCAALLAPGPEGEALDIILKAAIRVPDFQELRPYEFIVAKGDGLKRLGAMMERAAIASGQPPDIVKRAPKMPLRAPLVIVVVAKARDSVVVRPIEQKLTAGCAVMAMQMAAFAQGFGGIWRSGWPMFAPTLQAELGLAERDRIVGFLYLGTPVAAPERSRDGDPFRFVRFI
jgi:nitroreductase